MFDLEGLPPFLDELDRIYLWGVQVFGESPSEYLGVLDHPADRLRPGAPAHRDRRRSGSRYVAVVC